MPIKRRKLLLPLALTPLVAPTLLSAKGSETNHTDVLVLGAGMSGIACARELAKLGYSCIVLEARARIGGRAWTDDALGVPIDMGGAWIHGVDGNPLTALVEDAGISTMETDWESSVLYAKQKPLSAAQYDAADELYEAVLDNVQAQKDDAGVNVSLGTALDRASEALLDDDLIGATVHWQLWSLIESEYGESANKLSLRAWNEDDELPGAHVLLEQGYGTLIKKLARSLDIRLNHVVQRVQHRDDTVTVHTNKGVFTADSVVCSLPLGVLKAGRVQFDPPLPTAHQSAIRRLSTGALNKIVLRFPEVFWPKQKHVFARVDGSPGRYYEFYNLHLLHEQPILVALVAGDYSRVLEAQSDSAVVNAVMAELRAIFGSDIPNPSRAVRTKWASDPFALGSYSVIPPGASLDDLAVLARPAGTRLRMAGEATVTNYPGSVHGAYQSGLRAASQIAELLDA